jgi:hypothetical protein
MPWISRGRKSSTLPAARIGEFWTWWLAEGADATAAAYEAGTLASWAVKLGKHVHAIDEDLEWELGPGVESQHVLVVSAAGNSQLRATARRWRLSAPPPSATWSYSDLRLPSAGLDWVFDFAGHQVDGESVLVDANVDSAHAVIDVAVFHPAFPSMMQDQRNQLTFLLLDNALGEEAVETWIGEVSSSVTRPESGINLTRLQQLLAQLQQDSTDEDGQLHWVLMTGTNGDGKEVLAAAQKSLRPMTAPQFDTHVSIELPFSDPLPTGMPDPDALDRLRAMQEHLEARLEGSGRAVAHETSDGVRLLHFYVDGSRPAVEQLRAALSGWNDGNARLRVQLDPEWAATRHLSR